VEERNMSTATDSQKHSDTELQILSSHYSETFELTKQAVVKRDRLFLYVLIVITLLLLYMNAPTAVSDWLNSFVGHQVGNNNPTTILNSAFIGTILSLGLLTLSHTYFQTVLHVERQYSYVYELENQLSKLFADKAFIREGKHYRENMRLFSAWTKVIFWILSPALFLVFNIVWLVFVFSAPPPPVIYLVVDSLITLSTLLSLGFYLLAIIKKK
jgi:hypothetical protein